MEHTWNTRGTYVRGGVGGVFKDVVIGHVEHTYGVGWMGGVFKDIVVIHSEHDLT